MRPLLPVLIVLLACLPGHAVGENAAATQVAMAVTIDDLPFVRIDRFDERRLAQATTRLLEALSGAGIEAIGFVNEHKLYHQGELLASRLALLQQWLDAGMELGNHTYDHLSLNYVGTQAFEADILRGEKITRTLMEQRGKPLRYFRHPFLHVGLNLAQRHEVEQFLAGHGYVVAPVTILSQEWMYAAAYDNAMAMGDKPLAVRVGRSYIGHMAEAIDHAETLARDMFGQNIPQVLLLHANLLNADYLDELTGMIRRRGYRFATLDTVLQDRAYRTPDTYVMPEGDSWLEHWLLSVGMRPRPHPIAPAFVRQLAGTNGYRAH